MKKINKKLIGSIICSILLLFGAGLTVSSILASSNNGSSAETPIDIKDKASILKNIYDKGEDLVILSIVPFKEMITVDVMCPDKDFLELVQSRAENLYNNGDKNGNVATLRNGVANMHTFTVTRTGTSGNYNYTVDYPNYFINSIFPVPTSGKDTYKVYREYFSEHTEVRTVAASQLTDEDIDGADMIFIFGKVDRSQVITGMYNYLNSDLSADKLSPNNVDSSVDGLYTMDGNGNFNQYTSESAGYYDTFYKNSYGEYVSNDISWDMALKIIRYSYTKSLTEVDEKYYDRVPVIIESSGLNTESNMWKMSLILTNCTGLNADGTKDNDYYYKDILDGLKFEDELDTPILNNYSSEQTVEYDNKIINFDSSVQITSTSTGITITPSNSEVSSHDDFIIAAGGYIKVMSLKGKNYLYAYDSDDELVKRVEVTLSSGKLKVLYSGVASGTSITVEVENNDKYYTTDRQLITPKYYFRGNYILSWNKDQADILLNIKNQDIYNYVYINDSGSNGVFLMGVENFSVSWDCVNSAHVRDIPVDEMSNGLSWYFRYLFGADPTDFMYSKDLSVLEIEPCQDFLYDYANSDNKTETLQNIYDFAYNVNFVNYADFESVSKYESYIQEEGSPQITFKCVTTAEFNGMNEDLIAEYDIIVMGSQTGMMNTSNGSTIYNDRELDGYIYLAYGDLCKSNYSLLGWLPSDYVAVTSSEISSNSFSKIPSLSNDMTTGMDYATKRIFSRNIEKLWSPAVYNGLLSRSDYEQIRTGSWHHSSYINQLMDYYVVKNPASVFSNYTNINSYYDNALGNVRFSDNDITELKMNELIDYAKSGQPVVLADNIYSCTSDSEGGVVYPTSHVYSFVNQMKEYNNVLADSEAYSKLTSLIAIKNLEITSYSMKYDKDGDGVNEATVPEVTYDSEGLLNDSCILQNVTSFTYEATMLTNPGTTYHLELIIDKNTDGRYNEEPSTDDYNEVYYTKKFTATESATTVNFDITLPVGYNGLMSWRILVTDDNSSDKEIGRTSIDGYTAVSGATKVIKVLQILPVTDSVTLNLSSNKTFKNLLEEAEKNINYDISIDTITSSDFEEVYARNPYSSDIDYNSSNNYLKANGYAMVVIGFSDAYGYDDISNDNGALDCIIDFMNKGNAVLFTHDTVSYCNNVNYNMISSNGDLSLTSDTKWCVDFSRKFRDLVGMDRYSISQLSDLTDTSMLEEANVPKDINGNYITEIQGYNNFQIYRSALCNKFVNSRLSNQLYTLTTSSNSSSYKLDEAISTTTTAEELNEGQITKYPYFTTDANGALSVANTHSQYYQLDMEDEDIVVWYTLGGAKNTYYGDDAKNAGLNYYIYSKGNITYSGAGHSDMTSEKELQLFVNTIVKAAVAGNFVPDVTVTNAASLKNSNDYVLYPNTLDEQIEVKFIAQDDDLASRAIVENSYSTEEEILSHIGRFYDGGIYWIDSTGAKRALNVYNTSEGNAVLLNGEETSFVIYDPFKDATDVTAAYNAASQYDKNMYDCYQAYMYDGSVSLSIEVIDVYGETGSCNLKIVEHKLFNLN